MKHIKNILTGLFLCSFFLLASCVTVKAAEHIPEQPENGIPLVIVTIDEKAEGYGTIKTMNESEDHSVRCTGTVEVRVPEGYKSGYGSFTVPEGALKLNYIRGRGNTTWMADKKPYKIKLDKKQDFFGMGADKEWGLMASALDPSFMKNRITSWLSEQLGFEFTPQMVPIELVMKGDSGSEYLGLYYLSELVGTGKNRLDIDPPDKDLTAATGDPNITGGYLIPYYTEGQNSDEPAGTVFSTKNGLELFVKDPTFDDSQGSLTAGQQAQRTYITNYIQELEDLILEPETIDAAAHAKIAERMDMQSAVDYWWIQVFSDNGDGFGTSSTYLYKKRDGKLFWGPLWDMDFGYSYSDQYDEESVSGIGLIDTDWLVALREKDAQYSDLLKERWALLNSKLAELTKQGGVIDTYAAEILEAQNADLKKWSDKLDKASIQDRSHFEQDISWLKRWIDGRRAWINANVYMIEKVHANVYFESDGEIIHTQKAPNWTPFSTEFQPPFKDGYVFVGWKVKDSTLDVGMLEIHGDTTLVAQFVPESEAIAPEEIRFAKKEDWFPLAEGVPYEMNSGVVFPEDATNTRLILSSSNEDVAIINEDGLVQPVGVGDTTITATTYNGITGSYLLHIYDYEKTPPITPSIKLTRHKLTVKQGETARLDYKLPSGKGPYDIPDMYYNAKNSSICYVDVYGRVLPGAPGVTRVDLVYMNEVDMVVLDSCEITVMAAKLKKNPMTVSGKKVTVKAGSLRKKKKTIGSKALYTIKKAKTALTYKVISAKGKNAKKLFKVNKKTGAVTVKKGAKKGSYILRVQVSAASNYLYKAKKKTVKVKVVVV